MLAWALAAVGGSTSWIGGPSFLPIQRSAPSSIPSRSAWRRGEAQCVISASAVGHLSDAYLQALDTHYYATTAVQAFGLVATGDALAQLIEINAAKGLVEEGADDLEVEAHGALKEHAPAPLVPPAYEPVRTLRMGLLGLVIAGFGTSTWLRHLEEWLPMAGSTAFEHLPAGMYVPVLRALEDAGLEEALASSAYLVVLKAFLDACIWAPIANTLYLVLTPLCEGKTADEVREMLRVRFVPVMKTELSTFFPYNLLSFSLVPPLLRPFTTGFVSMCFAVYISWVTHLVAEDAPHDTHPTKGAAHDGDSAGAWATSPPWEEPAEPRVKVLVDGRELTIVGGRALTRGAGRKLPLPRSAEDERALKRVLATPLSGEV